MAADAFEDTPPQSERLTGYDEAHLTTYLRLLDAEEEGADWREVARIVFGLDVAADPDRAKRIHDSHLARARWMTEAGYRQILKPRMR
ncbi:uncharacterized protein DUF2285 [Paracoccus versutus]|uniref:Uncharacterized protein DUF2285 n=1 Tax=Paracoccus versutus TaxID=34007 RepID=A0AAQ0HF94_PARVE|nr:DUF2285 domain-containing protein [Paracoccus versutus]KGJ12730.1 hypothetical protein IT40_01025 [Paracoccus versutus]REG38425.1 uncharacterized protein DUF2285 [Paracoccus versutus]